MNIHLLKIKPNFYKSVISGEKKCEVRFNDRNYQVGDLLILWLFDEDYKSDFCICRITHIISDPDYCKKGYVILSISEIMDSTLTSYY